MDAERLELAARALLGCNSRAPIGPDESSEWVAVSTEHLDNLRAALAAPEPAQAQGGDTRCLFCRTELDPDEMDDGSDLPPLAPGVCSECFQRWHDEPVWRKRLKDATKEPAPEVAGEAVALPMRGDVGKPEATRDPIFLLRWRPRNRPIRGDRWTVEGVWFTREEAEEFARGHAYRWGSDKHGPCWQVYCVPADGTLAALLRARTAYNVAKVPPLYAHPTPRAEAASAEAVAREAAREAVRLADSDRGDGATSMSEEAIINRAVAHALRAKGDR